jgi:adenine-specific DNA glycosylase
MTFIPSLTDPPLQAIALRDDPSGWRLLVCCMMLNASNREAVDQAWPQFFRDFPDAHSVARFGDVERMAEVLRVTGCQNQKARRIVELSEVWTNGMRRYSSLSAPEIRRLPGCGPYASESWEVFKVGRAPSVIRDPVIRPWVEFVETYNQSVEPEARITFAGVRVKDGQVAWTLPPRLRARPGEAVQT